MTSEQRAEGSALVDEGGGDLTDLSMPAGGTAAHVTLLVAEFLAAANKKQASCWSSEAIVAKFIERATPLFGRYWRQSAREPGAHTELVGDALTRLAQLRLIRRCDG